MAKKKVAPSVNLWRIISRDVEEGLAYGMNRAYKHTDTPSRDDILEHLQREIMNALAEDIDFGD